jgi:hypothetical protein
MPTLDDLKILRTVTTVNGGDILPVYDIDSNGSSKVGGLPIYGILGLQSTDVATIATGATISTRVSVVTGTSSTVTLPLVAGNLRQVSVLNTGSSACTIDGNGSEQILTGGANANTLVLATTHAATLLSDGTRWYHISNDT